MVPFFLGQRPVPVLVRSREHPSHLVRIMIIMIKMMIYDNIMIRVSWLSLDHTHTLCTRYKLDRPFFYLLLLMSWTTLLASCKLKKNIFQKEIYSFYVSFIQHCFFLSGIVWAAAQNPRAFLPQLKKNSPSTIFDFTTSTWMRGCILSYPVPEKEKKGFI